MLRSKHDRSRYRQGDLFSPDQVTWQMLTDPQQRQIIELLSGMLEQTLSNHFATKQPLTSETTDERNNS
jgi:hypothetical protein